MVAATAELARQNKLLRDQAIELEQASALKSQFLANMSHEFRTPLNAILGYASILLQGISGDLTPGQRKALDRIASNGRHLVGIVSEILDIARIEAGRMPLQIADVHRPAARGRSAGGDGAHHRALEADGQQPRVGRTSGPMRSDRQKVKQIVLNLLSNALKFTRERLGDHSRPTRDDAGDGGDRHHRYRHRHRCPRIAKRSSKTFTRSTAPSRRPYGGTGLGLSICRRLATMLGGRTRDGERSRTRLDVYARRGRRACDK